MMFSVRNHSSPFIFVVCFVAKPSILFSIMHKLVNSSSLFVYFLFLFFIMVMLRFHFVSGYVKIFLIVLIISIKLSNFDIIITFILFTFLVTFYNNVFKQNIELKSFISLI